MENIQSNLGITVASITLAAYSALIIWKIIAIKKVLLFNGIQFSYVLITIWSFIHRIALLIFLLLIGYRWRFSIVGTDILVVTVSAILMQVHVI